MRVISLCSALGGVGPAIATIAAVSRGLGGAGHMGLRLFEAPVGTAVGIPRSQGSGEGC